jgi:hypothetical protein
VIEETLGVAQGEMGVAPEDTPNTRIGRAVDVNEDELAAARVKSDGILALSMNGTHYSQHCIARLALLSTQTAIVHRWRFDRLDPSWWMLV